MQSLGENYFQIPNQPELYCAVWQYESHHPALKIRVYHEEARTVYWLLFTVPIYVQCPMKWQGSNFRLGNTDECLALWNLLASKSLSKEDLLKYYRLFKAQVKTDAEHSQTVQIIARRGEVFPADGADLQQEVK